MFRNNTRKISQKLISKRLISKRLISKRLISKRLISQRLISQRLISQRLISQRLISQRLISQRLISKTKAEIQENKTNINYIRHTTMGYYAGYFTRKDMIENLLKPYNNTEKTVHYTPLKHCTRGNVLWSVWEKTSNTNDSQTQRFIRCDLMTKIEGDSWAYKPMDESVGPNYVTCPLSYLDLCPTKSEEWRKNVKAYWKRQKIKRTKNRRKIYTAQTTNQIN